jgi:DNA polymerase-4
VKYWLLWLFSLDKPSSEMAVADACAEKIRKSVREELGITVSIGVSFNKVFAKLGSDLKKPDAITRIGEQDYKEKIWSLPASSLIYFGRAAQRKLSCYGIRTIGDVARAPVGFLKSQLGKNGEQLWYYANGLDTSRVMHMDYQSPIKSMGRGITCISDLQTAEQVWRVILHLTQDIGHKLRLNELCAGGVQLTIKDNALSYRQYQVKLDVATQSAEEIALSARKLFDAHYGWHTPVRAVTVRAINLIPKSVPQQLMLFDDAIKRDKRDKLETAVEDIRNRFGKWSIYPAALMGDLKIPGHSGNDMIMPGLMYL